MAGALKRILSFLGLYVYFFYKVRQRLSVENKSRLIALNFIYEVSDK